MTGRIVIGFTTTVACLNREEDAKPLMIMPVIDSWPEKQNYSLSGKNGHVTKVCKLGQNTEIMVT